MIKFTPMARLEKSVKAKWAPAAVAASLALLVAACSSSSGKTASPVSSTPATTATTATTAAASAPASTPPAKLDKISVVLSWSPQPAQGGLFAAQAKGFFKANGLDVTLVPSGPRVPRKPMLASGKVQFGMFAADEILVSRQGGLPIVALYSTLQDNPLGFVYHDENPLSSASDMNGRTVYVTPGQTWWQWLKQKYNLKVTENVYQSLTPFLADKHSITQGFVNSEPFYAQQQGAKVGFLSLSQAGWIDYMNTIATTEDYIKSNPDIVKRFVKASLEGWDYYVKNPDEINEVIHQLNAQETPDALKFDSEHLLPLFQNSASQQNGFGYFDPQQWSAIGDELKAIGAIPADADVSKAYDTSFWKSARGS